MSDKVRFRYTVEVETDTLAQSGIVMAERLLYDNRITGWSCEGRADPDDLPMVHRADTVTDARTLDAITDMLRDPEWGVGMLEDIAQLIARTGRDLSNPNGEPTWDRH